MSNIFRFSVLHPLLTIIIIGVITVGLFAGATRLGVQDGDFLKELPRGDQVVQDTSYIQEILGNYGSVTVGVETKDFSLTGALQIANEIREEVLVLEGVRSVSKGTISQDGTSAFVAVSFEKNLDQKLFVGELDLIRQGHEEDDVRIHFSGGVFLGRALQGGIQKDLTLLMPLALLSATFVFFLALRRPSMMAIPFLVILLSVVWTFGIMGYIGFPVGLVSSAMPLVVVALGSSYGIHLILRYYDESREGVQKKEAIFESMRKTGAPIFFAGITSALGFGTLLVFKIPSIREFALVTAIGIMVSVFLTLVLAPAMLSVLRAPKVKGENKGISKVFFDKLESLYVWCIGRLATGISRHSILTLFVVTSIVLTVAATGIPRISSDLSFESFLPKSHDIHTGKAFFSQKFPELNLDANLQVLVTSPDSAALNIEFIENIESLEGVSHVGQPQGEAFDNVGIIALTVFLESDDADLARESEGRIREFGRLYLGGDSQMYISGEGLVRSLMNGYIVKGKIQNMILSVLLIWLFASIIFRVRSLGIIGNTVSSLGFGVLTVLPLLFSTAIVFGVMGWLGIPFNLVTALISGIAVGVGVDFAIHYLFRFRELSNSHDSISHVDIEDVTVKAARPILFDALSNIAGFSIFLFSGFAPLQNLGLLMALIMITCSLGTIFLTHAILCLLYKKEAAIQ